MTTYLYPIVSPDLVEQRHYELCRRKGTSHNMAVIFALRHPPGALTDREFLAGRGTLAQQFEGEEHNLNKLVAESKRNGRTPSPNDVYLPTLANYPGDPLAFVPPDDARGHVKRVCEARGDECRGMVKVKAGPPKEPEPGPPIAQDIIDSEVSSQIRAQPELAGKRKELAEQFIEQHAPKH